MTRSIHTAAIIAVVILFFCLSMLAQAAVPSSLNYQGYLTDPDGSPVDGNVVVTFAIYVADFGGGPLWSDTELVTVDQGLFSVELGADIAFPSGLFETPLWLGVTVDGDDEMLPRRPLTTVGFAFQADDALSLQGQTPATFDQTAHVADTDNPHGVDAAQAGAATTTDITSLQAQLDAAITSIAWLQTDLTTANATIAILQTGLAAEAAARISDIDAEETARMAADSVQDSVISGIQANSVLALNGVLTRPDSGTALFTAVNVQVVSGSGTTNGSINGLGNLFVGYNSARASGSDKSGSHNLIVGDNHNYSSYGGLVGGYENTVSGVSSSVSGGSGNTASGSNASVTGGRYNLASGNWSSVSGGGFEDTTWSNHAYADYSSILGGTRNTTGDPVGGDRFPGANSTISGGGSGQVTGISGSISGGRFNVASGFYSSVSGGSHNTASGSYSSVVGGGGPAAEDGGEAAADYSAIVGRQYAIGDTGPAGGLVFYVSDDGRHGLEAAPADQSTNAEWGCEGSEISGADGQVIGYGAQNTLDILTECTEPGIAADIARDYSLDGFNGWFLPSIDELQLMHLNLHRAGLGGFAIGDYWSSSEDSDFAWFYDFFGGGGQFVNPKNIGYRVRAARAF